MDKNTAFLLRDGYQIARLFDPNNPETCAIPSDSVMVVNDKGIPVEYSVTSTRITIIGRELPGGPLGDEYGIVCSEDLRSGICENTLGGGRLEPYSGEFREEGDVDAEESVIDCLLREVQEELGIALDPNEVMLVGLRTITEVRSSVVKMINGKICADAYFIAFKDERLGAYRAHNGETGDRRVLSPEELLRSADKNEKRVLPQTQRLAVATAIISLNDIFGSSLPKPIRDLVQRTLPLCRAAYGSSHWAKNYVPVIQQN